MWVNIVLIHLVTFCLVVCLNQQEVFNEAINKLTRNVRCTTNIELVIQYLDGLKSNQLEIKKPRYMKNDMNKFLWKSEFQNSFEGYGDQSLVYNICKMEKKTKLRDVTLNNTNVNISITKMVSTYPYLLSNLRPEKILSHLYFFPEHIQRKFQFAQYLIIDHKLYIKQYEYGIIGTGRILADYITNILDRLPNMYFYHAARDQIHMRLLKQWLQTRTNSHAIYDGLYESYKRVMVDFPFFMRSIDLESELEFNKFILVDSFLLSDHWQGNAQISRQTSAKIAFDDKQSIIFWRGAPSGLMYDDGDIFLNLAKHYPRLYAVNYSNSYPQLMDFKFTSDVTKISEEQKIKYNITYQKSEFVSIQDHLKYKYLISFDGGTAAWQRIPWIMMSTSILLKQSSYKVEWFYGDFIPDVHFIQVKQDLSDLVAKMQYLQKNPDFAKKIIKNANQYAKRFSMDQLHIDLANILKQYASYQQLTNDQAKHLFQTRSFDWNSIDKFNPPSPHNQNNVIKKWWIVLIFIIISIIIACLIILVRRIRNRKQNNVDSIVTQLDKLQNSSKDFDPKSAIL